MGEVVRMPLKAPTAASTLVFYSWEAILQDLPPRSRKKALITAYRGGLIPAALVSYLMDLWELESI
ncbi:MAG: hypothetical protein CMN56_05175 [Sneathiella sp.]|nr:hypothetical protein [Sneathiella sp.]